VLVACLPAAHNRLTGQAPRPTAAPALAQVISREAAPSAPQAAPGNPVVVLETSKGTVKIELFPEAAPKTVENFLHYVDAHFYDDTIFHRVIRGFVVQGGGFTPELEMKPTLPAVEIESKNGLENARGTVAMARNLDKDSATSQFFINLADNEQLNRGARSFGYAVFGRVIEGMEVVDRISQVQTSRRGEMDDIPIIPVFLESARREQR
jgi:peptidyl-prolyl cis-trans isomerase A (cyclophilin A)